MKNKADKKDTDPAIQTPPETEQKQQNAAENASVAEPQAAEAKPEEPRKDDSAEKIAALEKTVAELEDKTDPPDRGNGKPAQARRQGYGKRSAYSVMTDTLHPFFQVFDHFNMAVAATTATNNLQSLMDGMKMIQMEFDKAFSDLGIEKVDATGKDFDPTLHEAVSEEASDTVPAGKVLRQWCFGYKSGDRLLKPATVVVSSGPADKTAGAK